MNTIDRSIIALAGMAIFAAGAQAKEPEQRRNPARDPAKVAAVTADESSGAGIAAAAAAATTGAGTATECYAFNDVAPNTEYHVGDTINAEHAVINLREFYLDKGQPSQAEESGGQQVAIVNNSNIARGGAPELRMYLINANVRPQAPIRKVELKFAENVNSLVSNLEVNGQKRVIQGGLSNANGKVMGRPNRGRAAIIVNLDSTASGGGFNRGTLELHAIRGGIESWTIGGQQLFVDEICMTK